MAASHFRKVKIICTLGPATMEEPALRALCEAGMDIARLNFSHGKRSQHALLIQRLRKINPTIAILQDLQGPKLRVGLLPTERLLRQGERWTLSPEGDLSRQNPFSLPLSKDIALAAAQVLQKNALILFDDGKLRTRVLRVQRQPVRIEVEVEIGGKLSSHKGLNLPGTPLPISCYTRKDLQDLVFGVSQGVDAIALSFIRTKSDLLWLRSWFQRRYGKKFEVPLLIPKIEVEEAIQNHLDLLSVSDGLLIARGDMAVEVGAEKVPVIQKQLIRSSQAMGVPVITATQMLESMMQSPVPTRAEANDVANAVFDGTDAVMLSGETATGLYPLEAVQTMHRIICEAEQFKEAAHHRKHSHSIASSHNSVSEAIENSASLISEQIGARLIACITRSGKAAQILSKYRPITRIVALVPNQQVQRRLAFFWGVRCMLLPPIRKAQTLWQTVSRWLKKSIPLQAGDTVVFTAGLPSLQEGSTNSIRVEKLS